MVPGLHSRMKSVCAGVARKRPYPLNPGNKPCLFRRACASHCEGGMLHRLLASSPLASAARSTGHELLPGQHSASTCQHEGNI